MDRPRKLNYSRIIGIIITGFYFLFCALHPGDWHFIDNVDLVIHEAGHWIFIFFGEFIRILGGSLNQVLIPTVFAAYFFLKRDFYSGSLVSLWVGYNIVNVSVYMGDAVRMSLPLLGGDNVIHDWNYILGHLGLLSHTGFLSGLTYALGIFIILGATAWGVRESFCNNRL